MDVVGPLEKSSSGNLYILVICDYATSYPEAFPLRSVKAKQVANVYCIFFHEWEFLKKSLQIVGPIFCQDS